MKKKVPENYSRNSRENEDKIVVTRCENTEAIYGMEWNGMENIESVPSMIGSAHRPSEVDRL